MEFRDERRGIVNGLAAVTHWLHGRYLVWLEAVHGDHQ